MTMARANALYRTSTGAEFIDVQRLVRELSDEDLLRSADAYFAGLGIQSEQCHKPFSNTGDAPQLARNLGLLLEAASLFPGAEVLDFGCGTGWLSVGLAKLGCTAVGVDISPTALTLAERLATLSAPALRCEPPRFLAYDGTRLPLEDASVDRIVCFDSFHHVRDQRATIVEFARVLRKGGVVAMLEPGPHHSTTPQSQEEMRKYSVIENDVYVAAIAEYARAAGLDDPEMLVQFRHPLRLSLKAFTLWAEGGTPAARTAQVIERLGSQLLDLQCFSIAKGMPEPDSRNVETLGASLTMLNIEAAADGNALACRFTFSVRNTGTSRWRTGISGLPGTVNLGVQLVDAGGNVLDVDYQRAFLAPGGLPPRQETNVTSVVRIPEGLSGWVRFDVVSEHVAWLGAAGRCAPVDIDLEHCRTLFQERK
jgi:SAM-dependent methyltransferase